MCSAYQSTPQDLPLTDHILPEASGLTFSMISPHTLWSHNDSGRNAHLFALSDEGEHLGTIKLGIESDDLEDIDIAHCPHLERYCIWLGDVGDNSLSRDLLKLWVIPEPPATIPFETIELNQESSEQQRLEIRLVLEDGPADIEALAVEQDGQKVWFFEKYQGDLSRVWALDLADQDLSSIEEDSPIFQASLMTAFQAPGIAIEHGQKITAADFSPDGERLLIRVYTGIYEYIFSEPYALDELSTLTPSLVTLGPLSEPQGEALSYGWRGEGIWSISESPQHPQALHYFSCVP